MHCLQSASWAASTSDAQRVSTGCRDLDSGGETNSTMFRNILVLLGPACSNPAGAEFSVKFASRYGASLTGLYVRPTFPPVSSVGSPILVPPMDGVEIGRPSTDLEKITEFNLRQVTLEERTLESFLEEASRAGVRASVKTVTPDPGEPLAAHVGARDMLVVGRSDDEEQLLGSVIRPLARLLPVLTVARLSEPIDRIAVAYDGSPGADRALSAAADIASHMLSDTQIRTVHLLHVARDPTPAPELLEAARSYLDSYGIKPTVQVTTGAVAEGLCALATERRVGLLCIGAYGHSLVREVLVGSTTQAVLNRWRGPLLLCH